MIQDFNFPAFQNVTLLITMATPTNITGWTLLLNIRNSSKTILLQVNSPTIVNATTGIFSFNLTSTQTGTTLGIGSFNYDCWRIDSGSETQLVVGSIQIADQQWQLP